MPIAITGVGAASAFGAGAGVLFDALCAGRCGIGGDPPFGGRGPAARFPGDPLTSHLALIAAEEALAGGPEPSGVAVVGATTSGDMVLGEAAWAEVLEGRAPSEPLHYLWRQLCHRPNRMVADALGLGGPCLTLSTACTSGACAIGTAADLVASGVSRAALAFGADALCRITVHGFGSLGLVSAFPCRPFDRSRSGLSLGEGAGALLLEDLDTALARGARPLALLGAYGNATDAYHLTAPHPEGRGAEAAIRASLSGSAPGAVGWVSAHGTGTDLNDAMEAAVLARVLPGVPVSGCKGAVGHTLGAAGALEAVLAVMAVARGVIHPNIGCIDPAFDLDLPREVRSVDLRSAISVNFAFGGNNTSLRVDRWAD
jgi:3-oxoacyl-(acyl-carrier-protein) synthase